MRLIPGPAPARHTRRHQGLTAAAVAALFAVPACGSGGTPVERPGSSPSSSSSSSSSSSTTTSTLPDNCQSDGAGRTVCVTPGRPLRRRRRGGFLLPVAGADTSRESLAEYASVAAFSELALLLMAVGAPSALVARCHRAALDEIDHASLMESLHGRDGTAFGRVPGLVGRRIGGRWRPRRSLLADVATQSYRDGWLNEGAASEELEARAAAASTDEERLVFERLARDERGHADLARDIVLWCHTEAPRAVGRALARIAA